MGILKKLFGARTVEKTSKSMAQIDYDGFHIVTFPRKEGGQYRVCATISKEIDGVMREHKLVRADLCSSDKEASDIAIRKAQQMINEQGVKLFK